MQMEEEHQGLNAVSSLPGEGTVGGGGDLGGLWVAELSPASEILVDLPKGLVTPRDHGFFSSKNHVIEEI